MLAGSDFPSEVSGRGGKIWKEGSRNVKREKGQEGGMTWRQIKCDSVCVSVRETAILSI